MEIGKEEKETITVEPVDDPIPREPRPEPSPELDPQLEPVPVSTRGSEL
jgi:hypothetical protein